MGVTLAGAALLACISGALIAVFVIKRRRAHAALPALQEHLAEGRLAQDDQQKEQSTALQMSAAAVGSVDTDTASPEDVELIKTS